MVSSVSLKQLLYDNTTLAAPQVTRSQPDRTVQCLACGHRCTIKPGRAGACRVRFNRDGQLRVPAGYVAGLQIDPIEKKPFYHALPGREALSFGMLGCDLHCSYCQNWITSQALRDDRAVATPHFCDAGRIVDLAVEHHAPAVVSTYNEPLISAEWAVEIFKRARQHGLVCGFVSNGNATPQVLEYLRPYMSLFKVDLKTFDDKKYRQLGGRLDSVLDTIGRLRQMDFWVEVVTLVVPGFNDSDDELRSIARFLASIDVNIPWHCTAFHPDYKMTQPPATPRTTLLRAYEIGRSAGLRFVYAGNLPGQVGRTENTYCPQCQALLVERMGFYVRQNRMDRGRCPDCGATVSGVWEDAAPQQSNGPGIPRAVWG